MIPFPAGRTAVTPRKPRASGDDPVLEEEHDEELVVNPARAGMIRTTTLRRSARHCKPRASGDDPDATSRQGIPDL